MIENSSTKLHMHTGTQQSSNNNCKLYAHKHLQSLLKDVVAIGANRLNALSLYMALQLAKFLLVTQYANIYLETDHTLR